MITSLPSFFNMNFTDKDGKLTVDAYMYNDQLFQTLNVMAILLNSLSSTLINGGSVTLNGINPPSLTTAQITALLPDVPRGTIWYNSDILKLQFKSNTASIETITST